MARLQAGVELHPFDPRRFITPRAAGMQWDLMEHADEMRRTNVWRGGAVLLLLAVAGAAAWKVRQEPQSHELLQQAWALVEADPQLTSGQRADLLANGDKLPWQLFQSAIVHDPSLVPSTPPAALPDGTLRRWNEVPNRAELWAWLLEAEPALGVGQLHVRGERRDLPAVLGQRTEDGRYVMRAGQPTMSKELADAENDAAARTAAKHTQTAVAAAGSAATAPAPAAYQRDWTLTQLELLFPHAKPQPLAYVYDASTRSFALRTGADCPPADATGSKRHPGLLWEARRVGRQLGNWAYDIRPDWWLPQLVWGFVGVSCIVALLPRPHHTSQLRFAAQFVRAMRDTPSVRVFFGLPATGLRMNHRTGDTVLEVALVNSELEGRLSGTQWSHLLVGPEWLRQVYTVKSVRGDSGLMVLIAQKQVWSALAGAVHWGRWRVHSVLVTDERQRKKVELIRKEGKEIFVE